MNQRSVGLCSDDFVFQNPATRSITNSRPVGAQAKASASCSCWQQLPDTLDTDPERHPVQLAMLIRNHALH